MVRILRSAGVARQAGGTGHGWLSAEGQGGGDEGRRSDATGGGQATYILVGGVDFADHSAASAAGDGALPAKRLRRPAGSPPGAAQSAARAVGGSRAGAVLVSRQVFRFQRAALSREAPRRARHPLQLPPYQTGAAKWS